MDANSWGLSIINKCLFPHSTDCSGQGHSPNIRTTFIDGFSFPPAAGTESATIPPPACTCSSPFLIHRGTGLQSRVPYK